MVSVSMRAENVSTREYIGLESLKLELSVLNEGGVETHLPTANSEQGLYQVYATENTIQFHLDLDYFGLSQIEKIRNNKDLRLRARLNFTSEIPSQYQHRTPSWQQDLGIYTVPKSTWIERILSAFNFKNVFLLELPKLKENVDTNELVIQLNNALTKLNSGDYPGVLVDCQKALEATRVLARAKGYTNEQGDIDFNKFTDTDTIKNALEKVWIGVWTFAQPGGRHIGRSRGKEEAQFEILTTYGLVNLIVNSILTGTQT